MTRKLLILAVIVIACYLIGWSVIMAKLTALVHWLQHAVK